MKPKRNPTFTLDELRMALQALRNDYSTSMRHAAANESARVKIAEAIKYREAWSRRVRGEWSE